VLKTIVLEQAVENVPRRVNNPEVSLRQS